MFHKTSSRIKQFISPKKNKQIREEDEWTQNGVGQKRQLRPKSCIYQDRKSMDGAFMRRTNSNAAVQGSSPPLPSPLSTQHSLRSFCECGCNAPIISPPHSLSKFDTRSGISKDLCLRQDKSPRLILESPSNSAITFSPPNKSVYELYQTTSTSQIDLLEALALEPNGRDGKTPHQESPTMRNPNSDDLSKDIQQLIRETNHAFKVSESALTTATVKGQEWYPNQDSSNIITRKMSPRTEPRRQYRAAIPPTIPLTKPEQTIPQKGDSHDFNDSDFMHSMMLKPPAPSNSPQTLAEIRKRLSATPSRERFKQIIVDRRAESDRIHQLKFENLSENNPRLSSETSRSTESGSTGSTPLEPFHLDDLPLRIRLAAGLLAERPGRQRIEIRHSVASTITPQTAVRSFSSPPNTKSRNEQATVASEHEVVLKSTNYSLTSLGFRHGDIRVKRRPRSATKSGTISTARASFTISHTTIDQAGSSLTRLEDEHGLADEELDLQGFQMAISGATGYHWMNECEDCLIDGPHPRLEDLEIKLDELLKWWSEIGLNAGGLVQSEPTAEKERWKAALRSRRRREVNAEARAENSLRVVRPPEMCQGLKANPEGDGEDLISPPPYEDLEIEGEANAKDERDRQGEDCHNGEASLPPSPMQSIGPSALARLETFVPIGFNVDHDLGDFLRWKRECVDSTVEGDI
jgi:hypothetical protein